MFHSQTSASVEVSAGLRIFGPDCSVSFRLPSGFLCPHSDCEWPRPRVVVCVCTAAQLATMMQKGEDEDIPEPLMAFKQTKREVQCAVDLAEKVQLFVEGKEDEFKEQVTEEAKDLANSPFGATLLHAIGYVYEEQTQVRLSLKDGGKMFKKYQVCCSAYGWAVGWAQPPHPTPPHTHMLESANPAGTRSVHLDAPGQPYGQQPVSGTADPGVVKQDKSSRGSVGTIKTRSHPQRVRMCKGERPIGAAKGKQSNPMASCPPPPPPHTPQATQMCSLSALAGGRMPRGRNAAIVSSWTRRSALTHESAPVPRSGGPYCWGEGGGGAQRHAYTDLFGGWN